MISVKNYGPDTYGERIAEVYDHRYLDAGPEQVELSAELAGAGPVLELGIETGRLVLPLAARVPVHGIDASPAVVDRWRGPLLPAIPAIGAPAFRLRNRCPSVAGLVSLKDQARRAARLVRPSAAGWPR